MEEDAGTVRDRIERQTGRLLRDVLQELYVDKHLEAFKIAQYFGVSRVNLYHWLKKFGFRALRSAQDEAALAPYSRALQASRGEEAP